MNNSVLVEILEAFSRKERHDFSLWAQSGVVKVNANVPKLLLLLEEGINAMDRKKLRKEVLVEALFEGNAVSNQKMYDLISDARHLLEQFILIQNNLQNEKGNQHIYLKFLREKHLKRPFQIATKAHQKALRKLPFENEDQYFLNYKLADEQDRFFLSQQSRDQSEYLNQKEINLDQFYLISKLKVACEQLNRAQIIQSEVSQTLTPLLVEHIKQNRKEYERIPAIAIYYNVYLCLTQHEKNTPFFDLVALLKTHYQHFPEEEVKGMFHHAQNFCIRKINTGERVFLEHIFELYQFQLKHHILLEGKHLNQWDYKNIATVGFRLGKFEWVQTFLEEFKDKLPADLVNNAYHFNLAAYYFESGQYSKALSLLQKVDFTDVYYQLGSRCILLKVYYEQTDIEGLYALIRSFKSFLKRNTTVSETQLTLHLNLLRYTKKCQQLYDVKPRKISPAFRAKVVALRTEIEQAKITNKQWLLSKMTALDEA